MRKLFLIITALMLCLGISFGASSKNKNVFERAPEPPDGYALVYFYRLSVPPYLRKSKLLMDEKTVIKLPDNAYSWFYLKEGIHNLQTKWGMTASVPSVVSAFKVQSGETHYLVNVAKQPFKKSHFF